MVEWGRLLSGYWGEILSRRFESCPPRHDQNAFCIGARFSSSFTLITTIEKCSIDEPTDRRGLFLKVHP